MRGSVDSFFSSSIFLFQESERCWLEIDLFPKDVEVCLSLSLTHLGQNRFMSGRFSLSFFPNRFGVVNNSLRVFSPFFPSLVIYPSLAIVEQRKNREEGLPEAAYSSSLFSKDKEKELAFPFFPFFLFFFSPLQVKYPPPVQRYRLF